MGCENKCRPLKFSLKNLEIWNDDDNMEKKTET